MRESEVLKVFLLLHRFDIVSIALALELKPTGGPLVGVQKSQCVYGPENEIAAVTFFAQTGALTTAALLQV